MMDEFQFTGDTPALYYAQAAGNFKHQQFRKKRRLTASANKIYSAALNSVFADAFYDAGWSKGLSREHAAAAFDTAQAEGSPAVEPSPIPDKVLLQTAKVRKSKSEGWLWAQR